jgi:hypothetical protein
MSRIVLNALVATFFIAASSVATGALVDRGNGLIYDTDRNLTWVSDPNLGRSSPFDDGDSASDGRMTFDSAVAWAAALQYAGLSDWRLPKTPQRDSTCSGDNTAVNYGFGCTANELGHLFYTEFGAIAGQAVSSSGSGYLTLFGPIADEPGASGYWFNSPWCCSNVPGFVFSGGELTYTVPQNQYYAWAVRDGDVPAIPEPATTSLYAFGLVMLLLARHIAATQLSHK